VSPGQAPGSARFSHTGWWFAALAGLLVVWVWLAGQSDDSRLDQVDQMSCIELERELFFTARRQAPEDLITYIETELVLRCHDLPATTSAPPATADLAPDTTTTIQATTTGPP
jgi:hypothetical protein